MPFDSLWSILAEDEKVRANRAHLPADARRYILARAGLRSILGAQLGKSAEGVAFSYEPKGKPVLHSVENSDLSFSISHSGDWALIGIANRQTLGVDIERIRGVREVGRIADRFFAAREVNYIRALPAERQLDAFFACWTRKEAYVKALGGGLSMGLDNFAVSVGSDEPPAILEIDGSAEAASAWTLWAGIPAPGYLAAAAGGAPDLTVIPRSWLGSAGVVPWRKE